MAAVRWMHDPRSSMWPCSVGLLYNWSARCGKSGFWSIWCKQAIATIACTYIDRYVLYNCMYIFIFVYISWPLHTIVERHHTWFVSNMFLDMVSNRRVWAIQKSLTMTGMTLIAPRRSRIKECPNTIGTLTLGEHSLGPRDLCACATWLHLQKSPRISTMKNQESQS